MSAKQSSFILYHDMWEQLKELSNEERGKILEAIFIYHSSGEIIEMDRMLNIVFISIRSMLDRDRDKYDEYIEKQSSNGRKGGRPKNPTVIEENPENPRVIWQSDANPTKAKKADSDSVSDSLSVSLSDSLSDRDNTSVSLETKQNIYTDAMEYLVVAGAMIDQGETPVIPEWINEEYYEEFMKFILYWSEKGANGKIKAKAQKTFELKRRFATWVANKKPYQNNSLNSQKTFVCKL